MREAAHLQLAQLRLVALLDLRDRGVRLLLVLRQPVLPEAAQLLELEALLLADPREPRALLGLQRREPALLPERLELRELAGARLGLEVVAALLRAEALLLERRRVWRRHSARARARLWGCLLGGPKRRYAHTMSARLARRPQGGSTNRSERSLHSCEPRLASAPATARPSLAKPAPRSDGRPTPRLPPSTRAAPPLASTERLSSSARAAQPHETDGQRFARVTAAFTPGQRVAQRKLLAELRDRVLVREADLRAAFRSADEGRTGSVDAAEFAGALRQAHVDLPPDDATLLFGLGDADGRGRLAYEPFCAQLDAAGAWGGRFSGIEGAEADARARGVVAKYAGKVRATGRRQAGGCRAGRRARSAPRA